MAGSDREALGDFLRRRRSAIRPEQVGLPTGSSRRVPGLRREELAIIAGVSPDHYQRIEQGRVNASTQVLDAIATALSLNDVERAHLHNLAGNQANFASRIKNVHREITVGFQHLLDHIDGPAFVLNYCRDVLAWNHHGAQLILDFGEVPQADRNMVWLMLTDARLRALYQDWESSARTQVGVLRRASARWPGDRRISELVGRLTTQSTEFVRWWPLHEVREKSAGIRSFNHPYAGAFTLSYHTLNPVSAPEIDIFVYFATDSQSVDALAKLRTARN